MSARERWWRLAGMMALVYAVQGAWWPLLAVHLRARLRRRASFRGVARSCDCSSQTSKGSLSEVGRARRKDASFPREQPRRPPGEAHVLR